MLELMFYLAGLQMMIMLLAAAYRYIDLWYRIREFWPGITTRFLGLVLFDGALLSLLPAGLVTAFAWGQISYLVFHLVLHWALRLAIYLLETSR